MKRSLIALAVVVTVTLTAADCATAVQPTQTSSPEAESMRYVALGDSYTIGTNVGQSERWPNQLVTALGDRVPLQLVANLGVNGYSSADLIRVELPQLPGLEPDLVTLLIGVNDVVRGVSLDQYAAQVEEIISTILDTVAADRLVIVSTPDYTLTPSGAGFGDVQQQRAGIDAANSIMDAAANSHGLEFVDISSVANQVSAEPSLVAGDGLHPSGAQYALWVELIAPVVEELFGPPE